jgi:hypothetical protein
MFGRAPTPPPFLPAAPPAAAPSYNYNPAPPAAQPQTPRPIVRGVAPEEPPPPPPPPTPLNVPSPEQLGVAAAKPATSAVLDWSTAHARLDHLGATCFHLEKLADGGCSASCLLPAQQGHSQQFEARGRNTDEAVRLVLDEAEKWAAAK